MGIYVNMIITIIHANKVRKRFEKAWKSAKRIEKKVQR